MVALDLIRMWRLEFLAMIAGVSFFRFLCAQTVSVGILAVRLLGGVV